MFPIDAMQTNWKQETHTPIVQVQLPPMVIPGYSRWNGIQSLCKGIAHPMPDWRWSHQSWINLVHEGSSMEERQVHNKFQRTITNGTTAVS